MSILRIVGILRLIAVSVVVLGNKICTSDVTICLVKLSVDNVCNYLLASVPDMIYRLTVNCLFISQTIDIVSIACSCFAVCKSD